MKKFVVAGSYHQAMEWIRKDISNAAEQHGQWRSIGDYVYVSCAADLRGYSDPHGVFIGTWRDRVDIREIVETLMVQSTLPIPKLREIWGEVSHKVKPTPKINAAYHDEAAKRLAMAIDDEVLKNLMRKVNGGNIPTP